MVGLLPLCATTVIEPWQRERVPRLVERCQRAPAAHARAAARASTPPGRALGRGRARHRSRSSTRSGCAASWRACSTRTSSSAPTASARSRAITRSIPTSSTCDGAGVPGRLPAGGVRQRHVRRQLQLARPDLDAGERAASSARCCSSTSTTATTSRSSARPARGGMMNLFEVAEEIARPADPHLPARRGRAAPGLRRARRSSRPIRTGATTSSSTSTSTATTAPGSAPATRPAGPAHRATLIQFYGRMDAKMMLEEGIELAAPQARPRRSEAPEGTMSSWPNAPDHL